MNIRAYTVGMKHYTIEQSGWAHFLLADKRAAWLWLVVRLYVGWGWLVAGWEKLHDPAWVGPGSGAALVGFVHGALAKTGGVHPDVQWWYASFLTHAVLPYAAAWSALVVWGEVLVGVALILGFLVGISTLFGMCMNLNYMLAGTVSVNPIWFTLSIGLVLAWRISGYLGLDRFVLPRMRRYF